MKFKRFIRDARGNFTIITAATLLPIVLAVGIVADLTNMNRVESNLQSALDAAAMEVAINIPSNYSDSELEAMGRAFFEGHVDQRVFAQVPMPKFEYHGLSADESGTQHIIAEANYTYHPIFTGVLLPSAEARAKGLSAKLRTRISVTTGDAACVYALSRFAPRAFEATGSATIIMDGCVVASNSEASDAIYVGGSASVEADCAQSAGGIDSNGGLVTDCPANRMNAWPLADPFRDLDEPNPPMALSSFNKNDEIILPGRYNNPVFDGTKQLQSGTYYITGDLAIRGEVSGTDVTIFMKDGGITVNGAASLQLDAPDSGDLAGILFFSARSNNSSHKFNGNGFMDMDGYMYFPNGDVTHSGNNSNQATCMRIVADTIRLSGNSQLSSDCSAELGDVEALVSGPLHFTR